MTDREIRMKCLELANDFRAHTYEPATDTVERAKAFESYVANGAADKERPEPKEWR
jgi:hypothetical protein